MSEQRRLVRWNGGMVCCIVVTSGAVHGLCLVYRQRAMRVCNSLVLPLPQPAI